MLQSQITLPDSQFMMCEYSSFTSRFVINLRFKLLSIDYINKVGFNVQHVLIKIAWARQFREYYVESVFSLFLFTF